jgi:hypothetical protein
VTFAARYGICNRINLLIEMMCRGRGELLWAINDQCSLPFATAFPGLAGKVNVREGGSFPKGDCASWQVESGWRAERVETMALRVMKAMHGYTEAAPDKLALHGRWFRGGRGPTAFSREVSMRFPREAGAFLLSDCYHPRLKFPWPVIRQKSPYMRFDRDRSNHGDQLLFLEDLHRLWRAELVVTPSEVSTITDMRGFLGRPTLFLGPRSRRSGWLLTAECRSFG